MSHVIAESVMLTTVFAYKCPKCGLQGHSQEAGNAAHSNVVCEHSSCSHMFVVRRPKAGPAKRPA